MLKVVNVHSCAFRRFRYLTQETVEELRRYVIRCVRFICSYVAMVAVRAAGGRGECGWIVVAVAGRAAGREGVDGLWNRLGMSVGRSRAAC